MQDAQELDAAAAISMERLQEVHDRLSVPGVRAASDASAFGPSMSVERLRNGWRARRKMSVKTFCGPVRDLSIYLSVCLSICLSFCLSV